MITINDPTILAEVRAAFDAYEVALMANDIEAMDALFWHSPLTVRYGPAMPNMASTKSGSSEKSVQAARRSEKLFADPL